MQMGMRCRYTATDDASVEDVWNSRDGAIPTHITTLAGRLAWHSGPDVYVPVGPMDCRWVVDWHPGLEPADGLQLGWPGMPALVAAGGA